MVVHLPIRNPTKTWRNHRPHYRTLPLQQMELIQSGNSGRFTCTLLASLVQSRLPNTKPTSCRIKFSVTARWRNIAKYIELENATLERCSWRVQSDSCGVAPTTCTVLPLISKKESVEKNIMVLEKKNQIII